MVITIFGYFLRATYNAKITKNKGKSTTTARLPVMIPINNNPAKKAHDFHPLIFMLVFTHTHASATSGKLVPAPPPWGCPNVPTIPSQKCMLSMIAFKTPDKI